MKHIWINPQKELIYLICDYENDLTGDMGLAYKIKGVTADGGIVGELAEIRYNRIKDAYMTEDEIIWKEDTTTNVNLI